jgi:nitrate reductase alpha subunit
MGWLPSAPQLETNPLRLAAEAEKVGQEPREFVAAGLKSGTLKLSCEDPDNPVNFRAICSSGAPTSSAPPARGTNIS